MTLPGRIALAFGLAAFACGASAATFYRWVDKDGKVHYSDAPPKDAKDARARLRASRSILTGT